MGRKSRLKWEHRHKPVPTFYRPLETRWGTHPLARAFGGMLQGLVLGAVLALVCLGFGIVWVLGAGEGVPTDEVALFIGGCLLAGAVSGALAPIRRWIGGRRAQGIVLAGVAMLTWEPIVTGGRGDPAYRVTAFVLAIAYGLMFAKWFSAMDPPRPGPPAAGLDPEHRSGRRNRFSR